MGRIFGLDLWEKILSNDSGNKNDRSNSIKGWILWLGTHTNEGSGY